MDRTHQRFANRCLPLRIANQAGWWILNSEPVEAVWNGGSRIEDLAIRHFGSNPELAPVSHFGFGVLTWHIPYLFRTPPGYNLIVRGPTNTGKDGALALDGIVEADWAIASFTMNWRLLRPGLAVRFSAGEPICMIMPQRRFDLERFVPELRSLSDHPDVERSYREWSKSRSHFIESMRGAKDVPPPHSWQKHYFHGMSPSGERVEGHQVKIALRSFSSNADMVSTVPSEKNPAPLDATDQPLAAHFLTEPDLYDDAEDLRARYEEHFSHPFERSGKSQEIWDYWFVPDQYTYLRTDPRNILGTEAINKFLERLRIWARQTLGLPIVTYPFLSLYTNGCGQQLHNDSENGRLAYVYSLTRWGQRQFSGGETLLLKPDDYWDSARSSTAGAGGAFLDAIPSEFNQLLVFDDRLIHGVRVIQGGMSPLEGRVVLHGHVREALYVDGALKAEEIADSLAVAENLINDVLAEDVDKLKGFATVQLLLAENGTVARTRLLLNRLSARESKDLPARILNRVLQELATVRFATANGRTEVLLPITVGP